MAIHVSGIDSEYLEDLRSMFFANNVKMVKRDCLAVHSIEFDSGSLSSQCDNWHLLYMPSKKCFRFPCKAVLVPLFCDDNLFIVHDGHVVSHGYGPRTYFGTDIGLVNTGSYSLTLVGT